MIHFHSNTDFDIEALTILGVSVKAEGAIGYFGTGFKFALATLLRTGHSVTVEANGERYSFTSAVRSIRGREFGVVEMNGTPLGFTTEFGKNWEVWQAFRELHSNTLDEGGWTSRDRGEAAVIITVSGAGIDEAFDERHTIFLATTPIVVDETMNIHPNAGLHKYYRGVRAGPMPVPGLFTYNMRASAGLTEDRFIASEWLFNQRAAATIAISSDEALIKSAVLAPEGMFERTLDYSAAAPSDVFLSVIESLRGHGGVNASALDLYYSRRPEKKEVPTIELTAPMQRDLARAMRLLEPLYVPADLTMRFVEDDGVTLGYVRADKIFITRRAFTQGYRRLAGTIYEEYLHQSQGFRDCSRSFQDYLIDRLMEAHDDN